MPTGQPTRILSSSIIAEIIQGKSKRDVFKHNFGLVVGMGLACVITLFIGRQIYICWIRRKTCCKQNPELEEMNQYENENKVEEKMGDY